MFLFHFLWRWDKTYQVIAGFRDGLEVWVIVLQLGDGQLLLFLSKRRKEKAADRQETESCGNGDLKWALLVSGAGKQSTQNKWEVNTQPQEAINCSKDQLGPSRCPCLPLLWSCLTSRPQVCDGASRSELRKQRVVSFAQQFEEKDSHWRASKEVLYCALFVPPHQVQVIREDNYILLKKPRFYRRGR